MGCEVLHAFDSLGGLQVLRLPPGRAVADCLADYQRSGHYQFAEPDHLVYAALVPNDPKFLDGTLWGLHNPGTTSGSVADADIDAPEGWDILQSAERVVVAVVDTGIRATHEDLAANMWSHPTTGAHGVNTVTNTADSSDDNGHGTLVSGILGAVGNNGKGVVGVAWRVQLMACKALDHDGIGSDSTLVSAIEFARTNGARIINASLDSPSYSHALSNAIAAARADGILFVASSGNNGINVDLNPRYPACYDLDNIISVGYSTRADSVGQFSNYGVTNVDLVAPGEQLYSTFFSSDSAYLGGVFLNGTSLAAPYVAGALALMLERFPGEDYRQLIQRLLGATDRRAAFAGKVATGRLNLREALSPSIHLAVLAGSSPTQLRARLSTSPHRTCIVEASPDLRTWSPYLTNTTEASGSFEFDLNEPSGAAPAPHRFFRATAAP
jgi:subtilisin family serine protease